MIVTLSPLLAVVLAALASAPAPGDNQLTPAEAAAGWILLFDGKGLDGWMTNSGAPSRTPVQHGCINPHGSGGYMLVHKQPRGDFVLALDFKISRGCNSGVFIRVGSLTPRPGKDVGYNGIEVAIDDTPGAGYHDTGAIYDLVKPSSARALPAGRWNHLDVTCRGPEIQVELNGAVVSRMNLDDWTTPGRRTDGSSHKFDIAYKDHPRSGYLGLQDHGADCWFKNIKLKPLP